MQYGTHIVRVGGSLLGVFRDGKLCWVLPARIKIETYIHNLCISWVQKGRNKCEEEKVRQKNGRKDGEKKEVRGKNAYIDILLRSSTTLQDSTNEARGA